MQDASVSTRCSCEQICRVVVWVSGFKVGVVFFLLSSPVPTSSTFGPLPYKKK